MTFSDPGKGAAGVLVGEGPSPVVAVLLAPC
jgi:hypothetical protein